MDKVGVGLVYPPVYIYLMLLITWLMLTPWVLIRERRWLKSEWRRHKGAIVAVGFLSGFTYLMILFALTMSKVSYVAAVREVSIVLSAYFGIVLSGGEARAAETDRRRADHRGGDRHRPEPVSGQSGDGKWATLI